MFLSAGLLGALRDGSILVFSTCRACVGLCIALLVVVDDGGSDGNGVACDRHLWPPPRTFTANDNKRALTGVGSLTCSGREQRAVLSQSRMAMETRTEACRSTGRRTANARVSESESPPVVSGDE